MQTITEYLRSRKEQQAVEAVKKEKQAVAKAFNDLYTYRYKWPLQPEDLFNVLQDKPKRFYGSAVSTQYAWMCPECNTVHRPTCYSDLTGLHYPACCSTIEGHRIHENIRIK